MNSITVLAQLSGGAEAIPGAGGIVVVGFLFAVIVLALLAALTAAMGAWFAKQAADSTAKAAASSQAAAEGASQGTSAKSAATGSSEPSKGGDDPAMIALIAAAVHTAIGDRAHRVVSIRSAGPGWAQEGRRQIFSSHRVR